MALKGRGICWFPSCVIPETVILCSCVALLRQINLALKTKQNKKTEKVIGKNI